MEEIEMKEIKHFHDSDLKCSAIVVDWVKLNKITRNADDKLNREAETRSCRNCIHFRVCMHWQGLQDKYLKQSHTSEQDFCDSNLYEDCEFYEVAESDIIDHQNSEIDRLKENFNIADETIYAIEDALDCGADNDWARECIEEYKAEMVDKNK